MSSLGFFEIIFLLMFFIVGVLGSILWIWALVDCVRNEPAEGNEKLVWILIIIFTHALGGLLYVLLRRPQRLQSGQA